MDWYYAVRTERRGPVSEDELKSRISSGEIRPETLVWNQTFTQWQPAETTALFAGRVAAPANPTLPGTHICIVTHKPYPTSQMIHTEHGWVSAEGRDIYYQSLREGVPLPAGDSESNARADGKRIVVPIANPRLPRRCIKMNEPIAERPLKPRTLYWCTPWVALAILLNLLIALILYIVLRKKLKIEIPLSDTGRRALIKHRWIAFGIFILGVALIAVGGIYSLFALIPLGILAALAGMFYGSFKGSLMRVTKMKDGYAWLSGATPAYLESLPPFAG